VDPAQLLTIVSLLVPVVGVVWRLSTLANDLKSAIDRLARVETNHQRIEAHATEIAVLRQRLEAAEARLRALEDRPQPTGRHHPLA
jgi:type II secretory pathway component PulJ